jgi:hypothetical protein
MMEFGTDLVVLHRCTRTWSVTCLALKGQGAELQILRRQGPLIYILYVITSCNIFAIIKFLHFLYYSGISGISRCKCQNTPLDNYPSSITSYSPSKTSSLFFAIAPSTSPLDGKNWRILSRRLALNRLIHSVGWCRRNAPIAPKYPSCRKK